MQQNSQVRKKKLKGYASWLLSIWIIWFGWCRFGFACTPLVSPTDGHQYIRQTASFCRACPSTQPSNVGVWWWMVTFLSRFQSPKVRLVTSCGCLNLEIHCNIAKGLSWREGRGKETEKNWVLKTCFLSVGWCSIWTSNKERTPWDYESVWQLVVVGQMIRGDTWRYYSPPGWPEAPRTSDNFLRLCDRNYYDNTVPTGERLSGWFLGIDLLSKTLKHTRRFQVSKWFFTKKLESLEQTKTIQGMYTKNHKEGFKAIEVEGGNSRLRWPGSNSLLYFFLHLVIYHFLFGVTFSFQLSTNSYRFQWLKSWFQMNSTQLPTRSSIDSSETSCCRRDGMLMLGLWALFQN